MHKELKDLTRDDIDNIVGYGNYYDVDFEDIKDIVNLHIKIMNMEQTEVKEGEVISTNLIDAILKENSWLRNTMKTIDTYCIGKSTVEVIELLKRGLHGRKY